MTPLRRGAISGGAKAFIHLQRYIPVPSPGDDAANHGLRAQFVQLLDQPVPGLLGANLGGDVAALQAQAGVHDLPAVFLSLLVQELAGLLAVHVPGLAGVEDLHRALLAHHGHLGPGPAEHAVRADVHAVHGDVGPAVGLVQYDVHLRHGGLGEGVEQLCAVADDAGLLLGDARQVARHVGEGDDGDAEGVAEAHEAGGLVAGIAVQHPGHVPRLVGDDAHRLAAQAGQADDDGLGLAKSGCSSMNERTSNMLAMISAMS